MSLHSWVHRGAPLWRVLSCKLSGSTKLAFTGLRLPISQVLHLLSLWLAALRNIVIWRGFYRGGLSLSFFKKIHIWNPQTKEIHSLVLPSRLCHRKLWGKGEKKLVYEVKLKQLKDQTHLKFFYKDTLSMHGQHPVLFKFYSCPFWQKKSGSCLLHTRLL